jgi:flagellar protein FlaG
VADSQSPEDVGLVFEVGQNGQDLVIKIVDRQSQRIIRQIPPEEIQRFRQAIRDLVGLLLDQTG